MSRKSRFGAWGRPLNQDYDRSCNPIQDDYINTSCDDGSQPNNQNCQSNRRDDDFQQEGRRRRRRRGYHTQNEVEPKQEVTKTEVCVPFDAYGINTYGESYVPVNVVKDDIQDLCIPFVASIDVPIGFILPQGICATRSINVDTSTLATNVLTQYYAIRSEDCNSGINNDENFKMQVAVLNGALYYNMVIGNFTPAKPVQDSGLQVYTKFSTSDTIYVDKIVGYSPFGYQTPIDYSLNLLEGEESITLLDGRCIFKKGNEQEFDCLLANPDITKRLNYAYTITITTNDYNSMRV